MATKMKPAATKATTAVAKPSLSTALSEELPAFLRQGLGRGSEKVETADLIIPRLEIVQSLSPARQRDKSEYIAGADEGDLYNNVTRLIYPRPVHFVPVYFRKDFLIWKTRKSGGGFRGAYGTREEAMSMLDTFEDQDDCEILDTPQHFGLLLRPDNTMDEIVISMPRTKAKVSRRFNSLIRMHGGDRFSRAYNLGTVREKNAKGEFFNYTIADAGYVSEPVYRASEAMYEAVSAGKVQASTAFEHEDDESGEY